MVATNFVLLHPLIREVDVVNFVAQSQGSTGDINP